MKIIHRPTVRINNLYKDRIYTCPYCGIKFQVEDSDIKNVIEKNVSECYSFWYTENIPGYWIIRFLPCECGKLVNLTRLKYKEYNEAWDVEFGGEEIVKEKDNENT